jgi:Cu(I)/Ag(I) efflux system protein CusF
MKRWIQAIVAAIMFVALTAYAQQYQATGIVKRIDQAKGSVTLKHDPIKSLKWPAMTMDFDVRDRKLLGGIKPEQKVSFEFVEEKGRYVIVSIK